MREYFSFALALKTDNTLRSLRILKVKAGGKLSSHMRLVKLKQLLNPNIPYYSGKCVFFRKNALSCLFFACTVSRNFDSNTYSTFKTARTAIPSKSLIFGGKQINSYSPASTSNRFIVSKITTSFFNKVICVSSEPVYS